MGNHTRTFEESDVTDLAISSSFQELSRSQTRTYVSHFVRTVRRKVHHPASRYTFDAPTRHRTNNRQNIENKTGVDPSGGYPNARAFGLSIEV